MNSAVAIVFLVTAACLLTAVSCKGGLQIGVKERPETCDQRTKKGDRLSMHYTVNMICVMGGLFIVYFQVISVACRER